MRPAPELTAPKVICHNPRAGAVCPVASAGCCSGLARDGWFGSAKSVSRKRGENLNILGL